MSRCRIALIAGGHGETEAVPILVRRIASINDPQRDAAARVGSSQSRVAKMEAADASVSLDLIVRSLLALGVEPKSIDELVDHSLEL